LIGAAIARVWKRQQIRGCLGLGEVSLIRVRENIKLLSGKMK